MTDQEFEDLKEQIRLLKKILEVFEKKYERHVGRRLVV